MTDPSFVRTSLESWQTGNDEFLAAAVAWVRLRLARQSGPLETKPTAGGKWFQWRASDRISDQDIPEQDQALKKAAARLAEAEKMDPPPALRILGQRLGLSDFEQEILLLCAAVELDTRIAGLCAQAQDNPNRPFPTFALAMALFDDPTWDALSPERPLRHWRLIEINQPGAQPLTTSPLRADERIVNYLKGLNYLDDRLTPLLIPFEIPVESGLEPALPPSQEKLSEKLQTAFHIAPPGRPPFIQLVGADAISKQFVAWHTTAQLELTLLRLPAESLPGQVGELETLARLWERESRLLPLALFLDAQETDERSDAEKGSASEASPLRRFLSRSRGAFFLSTREVWPGLGGVVVDVEKPTPAEQRAAWAVALNLPSDELPARLTGQFNLNLSAIQQIARAAQTPNGSGDPVEPPTPAGAVDRVWHACLARTRPRLDVLAQRIDVKATWDDLVLPDTEMSMLRQIADQVERRSQVYDEWGFREKMNRGLGISALFAGESGTGKTMAAEVIASDLQLNLYRIDLSAVVSKYIGETEKNLRRLFDAAEDGGAILFFDEADALFGKRSEVKDSHDRYANIEINYLLQRMEAYRGLAVLATNMKSALDHAFLRRLRFIVNFPFPSREDRIRMWQQVFPAQTPVDGLDYAHLARLNLTGGGIHNTALSSAFMAAKAQMPITMPLVLEAARAEFRKMNQPVNEGMLRWGQ
ncbi:MAG: ATP-binding protein [Anaerolineales bacterium]|nr:ATP-binding protein [Anaerolineales bacterium]